MRRRHILTWMTRGDQTHRSLDGMLPVCGRAWELLEKVNTLSTTRHFNFTAPLFCLMQTKSTHRQPDTQTHPDDYSFDSHAFFFLQYRRSYSASRTGVVIVTISSINASFRLSLPPLKSGPTEGEGHDLLSKLKQQMSLISFVDVGSTSCSLPEASFASYRADQRSM